MSNIGVKARVPEALLAKVDILVERGVYINRQAAIFHAIKELVDREMAKLDVCCEGQPWGHTTDCKRSS